jgi:hypothetical protein
MRKTREKPTICEYFKKPFIKTMAIREYLFASFKE